MSSLKQVIINAIVKVSTDPAYAGREYASQDAAREDFVKALIEQLFPENPSVPAVKEKKKPGPKPKLDEHGQPIKKARSPKPAVSPDSLAAPAEPSPKKERKARSPMSEEQKAAMVAKRKATMEAKSVPEAVPEASPKKEKKEKTAEEKAAIAAKRKATLEAKKTAEPAPATPKAEVPALPASPPKAPKKAKKAPEPSGTANLDKFTPTQKKKLVEIAGESVEKKDVLSYLNGLSNAAYNDKKLEDHFRDYVASLVKPEPEPEKEEMDLTEVPFDGETYAVNPETKRVYTVDENGNATAVGYVGMAKFADMEIPTPDSDEE